MTLGRWALGVADSVDIRATLRATHQTPSTQTRGDGASVTVPARVHRPVPEEAGGWQR